MQEIGIIDFLQWFGDKYFILKFFLCVNVLMDVVLWCDELVDYYYQEVIFLLVIDDLQKIICVGMNYVDKCIEFNEINLVLIFFVCFVDFQIGYNGLLLKFENINEFDYEGELVVVIGWLCFWVSVEDVLDYVVGYSCYMDGLVRDWQYSWFMVGKNWFLIGLFGLCLVIIDDIFDFQMLCLLI